jgi:hypothetical protein
VRGDVLADYLESEEFEALVTELIEGYRESNQRGIWESDTDAISGQIELALNELDCVEVWSARDWLFQADTDDLKTAATNPEKIRSSAEGEGFLIWNHDEISDVAKELLEERGITA